jgi:hypothetical protein
MNNSNYDYEPQFNELNAYALGLLWADGFMHHNKKYKSKYLRIEILQDDFMDFEAALSSLGKLTHGTRLRKNRTRPITSALISNKNLAEWAFNLGFKQKSQISPCAILENISKEYYRDFIRGWIDGDGCFYINSKNNIYQFYMCGSYEQDWTAFENFLNAHQISYIYKQKIQIQNNRENKCSVIKILKRNDLIKLREILYTNTFTFLKRKKEKADLIPALMRKTSIK